MSFSVAMPSQRVSRLSRVVPISELPCLHSKSCARSQYQRSSRQRRCKGEPSDSSFHPRLSPCKSFHWMSSYWRSPPEHCSLIHSLFDPIGRSVTVLGHCHRRLGAQDCSSESWNNSGNTCLRAQSETPLSTIPSARTALRRNGSLWLDQGVGLPVAIRSHTNMAPSCRHCNLPALGCRSTGWEARCCWYFQNAVPARPDKRKSTGRRFERSMLPICLMLDPTNNEFMGTAANACCRLIPRLWSVTVVRRFSHFPPLILVPCGS